MEAVLPFLTALVGAGFVYLLGRRKSSGKIVTSEAATLWSATQEFQGTITAEMDKLRVETVKLAADFQVQYAKNAECEAHLADLRARFLLIEAEGTARTVIEAATAAAAKIKAEAKVAAESVLSKGATAATKVLDTAKDVKEHG